MVGGVKIVEIEKMVGVEKIDGEGKMFGVGKVVGVEKMVAVRKMVGVDYGRLCKTDYGYGRIYFVGVEKMLDVSVIVIE